MRWSGEPSAGAAPRRRPADSGTWPQWAASPAYAGRDGDRRDADHFPGERRMREARGAGVAGGGPGVPRASSPVLNARGSIYSGAGSPHPSPGPLQRLGRGALGWQAGAVGGGGRYGRDEADGWWGVGEAAGRGGTPGDERRDGGAGAGSWLRGGADAGTWGAGDSRAEWGEAGAREDEVRRAGTRDREGRGRGWLGLPSS